MRENIDPELEKYKLNLFKGNPGTKRLRDELVTFAEHGITHIDSTLAGVAKGETGIEDLFRDDSSHDFNHAIRVLKIAENLAVIGGDIDIIRATVLLHDLITYRKGTAGSQQETDEAAKYAEDLLRGISFPEHKISAAVNIIANTSFSKSKATGKKALGTEAYIMYDADKLDQTGAVGIMRYCASGGQMGRELYNPHDPILLSKRSPEVFKYTVDALIERLPKVVDSITIPVARQTARERNKFLELFLVNLELEIVESKKRDPQLIENLPGSIHMMRVFGKAGKESRSFYNQEDPFCDKREPDPKQYPLDEVILRYRAMKNLPELTNLDADNIMVLRRTQFMEGYFQELKYELEGELVTPPRLKFDREWWVGDEDKDKKVI